MIKKLIIAAIVAGVMTFTLTGCKAENQNDKGTEISGENNTVDNTSVDNTKNPSSTNQQQELITEDRAKEIALEDAGLKEEDVSFLTVKPEKDNGKDYYEVDFFTNDMEYDYEIDAVTGEIVNSGFEKRETGNNNNPNDSSKLLTVDEAKKIAMDRVEGATDTDVELWLDTDDGISVYEGFIVHNGKKYEFEIDAATGNINDWEEESVLND